MGSIRRRRTSYQDSTAEAALEAAQRAGVTVYVIYHPSADYLATDSSKIYSGQVQLAHVADETGGEAYFLGFRTVAFSGAVLGRYSGPSCESVFTGVPCKARLKGLARCSK